MRDRSPTAASAVRLMTMQDSIIAKEFVHLFFFGFRINEANSRFNNRFSKEVTPIDLACPSVIDFSIPVETNTRLEAQAAPADGKCALNNQCP